MTFSEQWQRWRDEVDLDEYEHRWDRREAEGDDVHGEADFVMSFAPSSVLDAGCGMGRVGIELDRRGVRVVGADLDADLLARATGRAGHLDWHHVNLADLSLDEHFDVVVMAGNVLPFAQAVDRPSIIAALADHLLPGGRLITGSSLRPDWPSAPEMIGWAEAAGLTLEVGYRGWDQTPLADGEAADYFVGVFVRSPR